MIFRISVISCSSFLISGFNWTIPASVNLFDFALNHMIASNILYMSAKNLYAIFKAIAVFPTPPAPVMVIILSCSDFINLIIFRISFSRPTKPPSRS